MSKVISYKLYVLSFPEIVAELIWLSQILALILYTITTNPLKMQYMTNTSIMRVGVSLYDRDLSPVMAALTIMPRRRITMMHKFSTIK